MYMYIHVVHVCTDASIGYVHVEALSIFAKYFLNCRSCFRVFSKLKKLLMLYVYVICLFMFCNCFLPPYLILFTVLMTDVCACSCFLGRGCCQQWIAVSKLCQHQSTSHSLWSGWGLGMNSSTLTSLLTPCCWLSTMPWYIRHTSWRGLRWTLLSCGSS